MIQNNQEMPALSDREQQTEGPTPLTRRSYSVPLAVEALRRILALPQTVPQAVERLRQYNECWVLMPLYRMYFPDDYAASEASFEIDAAWSYSPREVEFFYLVVDHLFPLDVDSLSDWGAQGERTYAIPLVPFEMHWYFDAFETLSPGWQLLRLLSGMVQTSKAASLLATVSALSPEVRALVAEMLGPLAQRPGALLAPLRHLCAQVARPFSTLGGAIALLQRKTGNPWMDTDPENEILYEGYYWCEQHIEEITRTYREAQAIEERVNHFVAWLEEDVNMHVLSILVMLRQALTRCEQEALPTGKKRQRG